MFADDCEDLAYDIASWMQGLDTPLPAIDEHAELTARLCADLRSLAIMVLLAFGKTDRFHHNLIRSGRLRQAFLTRCLDEGAVDTHDFVSGIAEPLHDAMAAGDWALANAIAQTAPAAYRSGHEYEDEFCYAQLLRLLIAGPPDGPALGEVVQRMERALGGSTDPRLEVCRALGNRDQAMFDTAFEALLDVRAGQIEADEQRGELAEPPVLAKRAVFVEGLALLRLAQRVGLTTEHEYRYCPSLARLPMFEPMPEE